MKDDDFLFNVILFVVIVGAIAAGGAFLYSQLAPGRYQMQQTGHEAVLVLDTATGEVTKVVPLPIKK